MKRALIVDDHAQNLYLLRVLLQAQGFAVDTAADGAAALALARQSPPDLVVSDLLMPVLDGYALLRHWGADERLKDIPFVVYTATYTAPQDRQLALALGADAFIVKPAEPEDLLRTIQDVVARHEAGGVRRASPPAPDEAVLLKQYNEVLIHKLEQKLSQLEQANRELRKEIDERNRMQAQADHANGLLRAVIQSTSEAVYVKDRDGRYLMYNSAAAQYVTQSSEEILGRTDEELHGSAYAQLARPHDQRVMDTNEVHTFEEPFTVGGTERVFLATKAPYRDAAGNCIGIVGIARDITERKQLEEQLRQSQKMEAIGRLAGGVAHDFNNLLTIIASYGEILQSEAGASAAVRDAAKAITAAGERASALTRQLLGFSRQVILQPQVLDLNAVVADTGEMLRRLIGGDVEFITIRDPNLGRVRVDRTQLDQVLMNLAVNARDAMPNGGRLTIETANVRLEAAQVNMNFRCDAGDYVTLAVSDTGCGMTPEVLAHIFEPFFTTKEVGKGTGLGLAMVFGIVQQSGGCIRVETTPGCGSTFRIYLPLAEEAAAKMTDLAPAVRTRGNETILLVEDDEGVREVVTASLELHGYDVITAFDGKEALRIAQARREHIDLVLTDVVMPNLSGSELARALRERFPKLKVLFMSGYTADSVVRDGLLQSSLHFIQKPFTPLDLAQKVREVLDAPE